MPYIGNTPALDYISFAVQNFTVTAGTTVYTLDYSVSNENDIALYINNVAQRPGSSFAYSATGTTLTLTSATLVTDTMYAVFIGRAVQTVTPPANINLQLADGTAAAPSLNFANDTNTGIFRSATDTIDFAEGGVATGQFDSSGNFKFNSGYGSVKTAFGCRAWVNFDGTGTIAIRASGNVSSLTDNGTGYYSVNFTTAMVDANYCVVADSGIATFRANTDIAGAGNQTVSSSQVITSSTEDATVRDAGIVCLAVFR